MHVANFSTHYLLRSIVYKKNFWNNLKKKKSGTTKTEISLHRYYYQVKAVTYKTHHHMLLIGIRQANEAKTTDLNMTENGKQPLSLRRNKAS